MPAIYWILLVLFLSRTPLSYGYGAIWDIFRKQILSRNVVRIVVFLTWDAVVNQELFWYILSLIYPHILCCNHKILSIRGSYDPPNMLKLYNSFWVSQEDGLHHIYWNIQQWNHPHRGKKILLVGPIIYFWMELANIPVAPCEQ